MEYLLNLGLFYAVVIPKEGKFYILNVEDSKHPDIQSFLLGEAVDYSNYESDWFPYFEKELWTSYQDKDAPKEYSSETDLGEERFFELHFLKKYSDGILAAIKDPEKDKVKVFKKNVFLQEEQQLKVMM